MKINVYKHSRYLYTRRAKLNGEKFFGVGGIFVRSLESCGFDGGKLEL